MPPTPSKSLQQTAWATRIRPATSRGAEKGRGGPRRISADYGFARLGRRRSPTIGGRPSNKFKTIAGLTDAQKQQAEKALAARLDELAEYFGIEEQNITEYRHELWRLANWRQAPEAGDVPFHEQRITAKAGETTAKLWRIGKSEVGAIEDGLPQRSECAS